MIPHTGLPKKESAAAHKEANKVGALLHVLTATSGHFYFENHHFENQLFLFASSSKLSNYADDNTLYTSGYNLEEVKEVLLNDLNKVTEWFFENYMVLNAGKCHFMCLGKNTENETFIFKDTIMNNSKEKKTRSYYRK